MGSIAVIGEAVADAMALNEQDDGVWRLDVRPGGSPANTAVALARLGTHARFFGRLSTGVLGGLLRDHLERSGVDLSDAVMVDAEATLAIASLDEAGHASYDFYFKDTADWQWTESELRPLDVSAIHTGSLALVLPPGDTAIDRTLRRHRDNATVSLDPNVRPAIASAQRYRDGFESWAGLADIVKLSDDDLEFIHPGEDWSRVCRRWHDRGVRLIVVTRGGRGAYVSLDGDDWEVPAVPVTLADSIGAGDAFTAGLLHRLEALGQLGGRLDDLDRATATTAVEFAGLVAARTCAVPGADPPWAARLEADGA